MRCRGVARLRVAHKVFVVRYEALLKDDDVPPACVYALRPQKIREFPVQKSDGRGVLVVHPTRRLVRVGLVYEVGEPVAVNRGVLQGLDDGIDRLRHFLLCLFEALLQDGNGAPCLPLIPVEAGRDAFGDSLQRPFSLVEEVFVTHVRRGGLRGKPHGCMRVGIVCGHSVPLVPFFPCLCDGDGVALASVAVRREDGIPERVVFRKDEVVPLQVLLAVADARADSVHEIWVRVAFHGAVVLSFLVRAAQICLVDCPQPPVASELRVHGSARERVGHFFPAPPAFPHEGRLQFLLELFECRAALDRLFDGVLKVGQHVKLHCLRHRERGRVFLVPHVPVAERGAKRLVLDIVQRAARNKPVSHRLSLKP